MSSRGSGNALGLEYGRSRRWTPVVLRAVLTLGILGGILAWLPRDALLQAIRRVPLGLWLCILTLNFTAHVVAALKWRVLLRAAGLRPGLWETLRAHLAGLFANLCLPSLVGGDLVRVGLMARRHPMAPLAVGAGADRVLDTTALVMLSGLGALLAPRVVDAVAGRILGAVSAALLTVVILAPWAVRRLHGVHLPERLEHVATKLRGAVEALWSQPRAAGLALMLALGIQCGYLLLNVWLGRAVGIEAPVAVWFMAWPLAKLAGLVPISLGGLGVREAALAGLLAPFGVDPTLAVAQSLVWQTTVISLGLIAGATSLWMGRGMSPVPAPAETETEAA